MEIFIQLIAIALFGIIGIIIFLFLKEPKPEVQKVKEDLKEPKDEIEARLQKRIASYEQKIKELQEAFGNVQLELAQTKEKEKELLREKASNAFDKDQFEKLKIDKQALSAELSNKEELLEKEIDLRRRQAVELIQYQQESETLKKKMADAEDAYRKSQAALEALSKELTIAKKNLLEQSQIVQRHQENKVGGEWVSRQEFEKIEKELTEKEALIQKLLNLKEKKNE